MTPEIRAAVPEDEEALMRLLRLKHTEDGIGAMDEDKVRMVVRRGIARYLSVIGVVRARDMIQASIGLYVTEPWYSRDTRLEHLWSFVHPSHRKSDLAKQLLEFAKSYAVAVERPLYVEMMETEKTTQKVRLCERRLPKAGILFVYNPPVAA